MSSVVPSVPWLDGQAGPRPARGRSAPSGTDPPDHGSGPEVDVPALLAAAAGPAWVYDRGTLDLLAVNPAAAACYGYRAEELTARGLLDLFPAEDAPALRAWLAARSALIQSSGPWRQLGADGREFEVMITSRLVEYDGRPAALAVVEPVPILASDRAPAPARAHQMAAAGTGALRAALGELLATIEAVGGGGAVVLVGLRDLEDLFAGLGPTGGHDLAREVHQRLSARAGRRLTVLAVGEGRFCGVSHEGAAQGRQLADELIDALSAPVELPGHAPVRLSASAGVRLVDELDPDPEAVLSDAYLALGEALEHRRPSVVCTPDLKARRVAHLVGRQAVVQAIADGSFHAHYQPVVDLRSGRTDGFEALLRWPADRLVDLRPDQVVALAEESGLGVQLGELVLTTAIADAGAWQRRGLAASVAVNVSATQLSATPLARPLADACKRAGTSPSLVTLELTESSFISLADDPVADRNVAELRELGVRFAIDDFGTGYSSLSYLRSLPADVVKLDRTFIAGLPGRPTDQLIVEAVVKLCHALDLQVVAEGVETPGELALLDALEVDRVQGYLFSPAVPLERVSLLSRFNLRALVRRVLTAS